MKRDALALAKHAEKAREYRQRNREKVAARAAVQRAIRRGGLVRPDGCGRCGVACKPEASHGDYAKPLDVEWLCRRCHETRDLADHCTNGHAMTEENSVWVDRPIGRQRRCRACARMWSASHRAKRKETEPPKPDRCRNGHEMTPDNTCVAHDAGRTYRRCRICRDARRNEYRARRKDRMTNLAG